MSSHFGSVDSREVNLDFWLAVHRGDPNSWQARPRVRVTAGEPTLDRRERAINVKMTLPIALFETPSISATIKIDEPLHRVTIDASAIAEAVRGVIGMDVDIQVADGDRSDG